MSFLLLLISFSISAILTALILPKIMLISFKKKLFDTIDGRKVHQGIVPRLGGVAFTPAIIITNALIFGIFTLVEPNKNTYFTPNVAPRLALILCALLLLYLEGVTDDLIQVSYKTKFVIQILCATAIVCSGIWINNLYGLFGITALPWYIGMPFSVLVLVYCINAVNLIDGIDGLASGLSSIALFFMGCLFFHEKEIVCAVLAFSTLGTLVPFFRWNVFGKAEEQKKIFMGDCGSQTIGLILGILALMLSMSTTEFDILLPNSLVVAFSLLMIPCLDVIRVMIGRIRRHTNPFLPDKTHIHHKFIALGMSHRTTMIVILMLSTFFGMLNLLLVNITNINIILFIDIFIWTTMHLWISVMIKKRNEKT